MKPAGRKGDIAVIPGDTHGGKCCPHMAIGPAKGGSNDVLINGQPALRVQDTGESSCGHGDWIAISGAPGVYFNGAAAHRVGDAVECAAKGALAEGSPNVLIGDHGTDGVFDRSFIVFDELTGFEISNCRFEILLDGHPTVTGRTDRHGRTRVALAEAEVEITIRVFSTTDQSER